MLQFINKNDLTYLIGRNIFMISLKDVHRRLGYKYPQIAQLKIVKHYPDELLIQAKKRYPLAQAFVRKRIATVDEHAEQRIPPRPYSIVDEESLRRVADPFGDVERQLPHDLVTAPPSHRRTPLAIFVGRPRLLSNP